MSTENLPVIRFSLSYNDLNLLKSMDGLFTSINRTFLSYSVNLIKDMNENFVKFSDSLVPSNIFPDITPPELQIFDTLDFNGRIIILIFTEPVNITTVNFTKISLQVFTLMCNIFYFIIFHFHIFCMRLYAQLNRGFLPPGFFCLPGLFCLLACHCFSTTQFR